MGETEVKTAESDFNKYYIKNVWQGLDTGAAGTRIIM
jgi:hypothetical protein